MVDIPGNTTSTAAFIGDPAVGATFSGELETFGDIDYIRVTLQAGVTYRFYGSVEGAGVNVGNSDMRIRNAAGVEQFGNDDDPVGGTQNSFFAFAPVTTGTYFIDIRSATGLAGLYSIAVTAVAGTDDRLSVNDDPPIVAAANRRIVGDKGDDIINLGANSHGLGEQGDDTINGDGTANFISGGLGNDSLFGNGGIDSIFGDAGLDFLNGGAGNDKLYGGAGADNIVDTGGGLDFIVGGEGGDFMEGGTDNDTMLGEQGDDIIYGQNGEDVMNGGSGIDEMHGGASDDTFYVDNAADRAMEITIDGTADTVFTTVSYALLAGQEIEFLRVQDPASVTALNLTGNEFNNALIGNNGANTLDGGVGNDGISAAGGADILIGNAGKDTMTGGGANDIFRFGAVGHSVVGANADIITDFDKAGDDRIDVSALFGPAMTYIHNAAFSAAGQVRINDIAGIDLLVEVNTGGSLAADSQIRLTNTTLASMAVSDFIL